MKKEFGGLGFLHLHGFNLDMLGKKDEISQQILIL